MAMHLGEPVHRQGLTPILWAGHNSVIRDAIVRKLDILRRDVIGWYPSVLEHLLADRVALGWVSLSVAEGAYHPALERGLIKANETFHQQRIERAQRRYLAAIKALMQIRKMGVPAVQVNIGEKQIKFVGRA